MIKMLLYDHRMIEGSPLQYHRPCYEFNSSILAQCDYYPRIGCYWGQFPIYSALPLNFDMSEDMMVPPPHSPQLSDSEGSISSIESHTQPKQKPLKCCWRNCGLDFDTLDALAAHVGTVHGASGPGGLFYCGWEGCTRNQRAFNARYKMLVHVRTHTNEKPHRCYECDKSFSRAENLKIHTRSHSGEKPYACPVAGCTKAYSNSSDRFKHTRTHQVDKPYQCKVAGCSKRYTDPSSLRKHVKTYKHFAHADCALSSATTPASSDYEEFADYASRQTHAAFGWNEFVRIGTKIFTPYAMELSVDSPLDLSIARKGS